MEKDFVLCVVENKILNMVENNISLKRVYVNYVLYIMNKEVHIERKCISVGRQEVEWKLSEFNYTAF